MNKLFCLTGYEIADKVRKKEIKPREIVESLLGRINSVDSTIKAYLSINPEQAIKEAESQEKAIINEKCGTKLAGVPIAIKDNICVQGMPVTCASKILSGFYSPYNATVIKRLRSEGAIILGRTNMDEFAMGSSTENSAFQITKNPHNIETIPGGSSGGSAAAVAADEAIIALGSDTGGSIRQPAALCGVVGMKPTYGLVSRYGLVAFASSLDQIGPITKDVQDSALLLDVISGHDPKDSTSLEIPPARNFEKLGQDIKGLRVGIPKEYFVEGMDKEINSSVKSAIKKISELGVEIKEISLPHTKFAVSVYYIVATAEASANLARYDGVKYGYHSDKGETLIEDYFLTRGEGFGSEVKRRILLGTYVLSSGYYDDYYLKAQKVRTLIKMDFDKAFNEVDLIVTPTSPTPAFKIGEKTSDPLQMYLSDIYTISANLAGIPGISIPCGITGKGMPVGLQILGPVLSEEKMFRLAYAYESITDWHNMNPTIKMSNVKT